MGDEGNMINIKGFTVIGFFLPREDGTFWVRMAFYMLPHRKSTKKAGLYSYPNDFSMHLASTLPLAFELL
jgi:hypothetical protein